MKETVIEIQLNNKLSADKFNTESVIDFIKQAFANNAIKGIKYFDLTKANAVELKKVRQLKIEAIGNENYELGANLRDEEKKIIKLIELQNELNVSKSTFMIIDNILTYCNFGTSKNDVQMHQLIIKNFNRKS